MTYDWPDCVIDGCPRKCCRALNSVFCFPHTPGNKHVKHWKIEARNGVSGSRPGNDRRFTSRSAEKVS